jgi:hypothetical protein
MEVDVPESVSDINVEEKPSQEEEDEVMILKEGKKDVVLMEIDVDDDEGKEKNEQSVENNLKESDEKSPIQNEENSSSQHSNGSEQLLTDKLPVPSFNVISKSISSPIVIDDEDSSSRFLPGISEDSTGGVFGFALNSRRRERSESPITVEERKIIYKSMEFDFPKIKLEPLDEPEKEGAEPEDLLFSKDEEAASSVPIVPELEEASGPEVESSVGVTAPPEVAEPVNIDLTCDDDSSDEVDGGQVPIRQMTAIDGNLTQEGK